MMGVVFTVCIFKCTVALILFSFRMTRTSVNTDVLGGPQKSVLTKFYWCLVRGHTKNVQLSASLSTVVA